MKHAVLPVHMRDAENDRDDLEQRACVSEELDLRFARYVSELAVGRLHHAAGHRLNAAQGTEVSNLGEWLDRDAPMRRLIHRVFWPILYHRSAERLMEQLQVAAHAIGDIEALLEAAGVDDDEDNGASKYAGSGSIRPPRAGGGAAHPPIGPCSG